MSSLIQVLSEVYGIRHVLLDQEGAPLHDCALNEELEGAIKQASYIWLGLAQEGRGSVAELEVFGNMVGAFESALLKKNPKLTAATEMLLLESSVEDFTQNMDLLLTDKTYVVMNRDLAQLLQQLNPSLKIFELPDPFIFEKTPGLKKTAWQTLLKIVEAS